MSFANGLSLPQREANFILLKQTIGTITPHVKWGHYSDWRGPQDHGFLSTLATSCEELTHWKRLWCWEGLGAGGEGYNRRWDGWMASPTRWTWVWVNSRSSWWTGRPGVLRFMGLQRVGHDWATELNWNWTFPQWDLCQFLSWVFINRVMFLMSIFSPHNTCSAWLRKDEIMLFRIESWF